MRLPLAFSRRRVLLPLALAATIAITATAVSAQADPSSGPARSAASPVTSAAPVTAASSASAHEQLPAGFTEHKVRVGSLGVHYVIGGHGPTLVLLHGYPQTWYEWRHIMPALAEHYTVIAPDLPGAGKSDAPATGYDKKTLAADIHGLLVKIGRDHDIRIVGHDIGTMVAYSYAAAHPRDVTRLVLSEAPIPDPSVYGFPSLTADGPGAWHFGFFALTNGLPEDLISGRETLWTDKFIDDLEVRKGAVTPDEIKVFASYLRDPAHLEASLAWFRTLPEDIRNDAVYQRTRLTMPVLAIGAQGSLGDFVPDQVRQYATDVTGVVVPDSGHWMYEEHPAELTAILLDFLGRS
ncbi:alpha/beta fold hydrolase [Streptomyces polygonati]|uniref:Alpha/beta fold hydrolase n=1 Tax=Streptomyces polygonati TaxID=1617087 RepID=A0ABV8HHN8_9ACTN